MLLFTPYYLAQACFAGSPLIVNGGAETRWALMVSLFCWQPSTTPVRPLTSSVTMGTASPSGGRVMATWIAKMVLMRIQSTVVNTNPLALTRSFSCVCCSGRGSRWARKCNTVVLCPRTHFGTYTSPPFHAQCHRLCSLNSQSRSSPHCFSIAAWKKRSGNQLTQNAKYSHIASVLSEISQRRPYK